jgi:hypothetical protein
MIIRHNIFWPDGGPGSPRFRWAGGDYDTLAAWQKASGSGANCLAVDPQLKDPERGDFSLEAGSPAIDAGIDVGLTRDYAGNPIRGRPDVGAIESGRGP